MTGSLTVDEQLPLLGRLIRGELPLTETLTNARSRGACSRGVARREVDWGFPRFDRVPSAIASSVPGGVPRLPGVEAEQVVDLAEATYSEAADGSGVTGALFTKTTCAFRARSTS
jgi:hypothetical protein